MDKSMKNPLVSICVPIHNMKDKDFFLDRCLSSIREQSYKNWELVITEDGLMAKNTNSAIKQSYGDIIKILYMDDFFAHKDALKRIVECFTGGWLVTGCTHTHGKDRFNEHKAEWNENIHTINTIGSPSVLAFENKDPLLFDEKLSWMLDADLYKRLYARYGLPTILDDINVVIGVGDHQTTHLLSDDIKEEELAYTKKKYE